jgi:hypothetical protein
MRSLRWRSGALPWGEAVEMYAKTGDQKEDASNEKQ